MDLTREYISSKTFTQKKGKYDAAPVDEFMRTVADGVEELSVELEKTRAGLAKYKEMEASMIAALVSAQRTADSLTAEAKQKADAMVEDAKAQAAMIQKTAAEEEAALRTRFEEERSELAAELVALHKFREEYVAAVKKETEEFLEQFENQPADELWARRPAAVDAVKTEQVKSGTLGGLDINEILKNLPQSDSDLKAMIDELI